MNETLQDYVDSINYSIETLRNNKDEIQDAKLPSDFKLMMTGVTNSKVLDFIFNHQLDYVIDNLLNKLMNFNFDNIDNVLNSIQKLFDNMGLGKGKFNGPVSQMLLTNIQNTLNSINFNATENKIKKVFLVLKNLKNQAKNIDTPELREKYKVAVHALKKVLMFISKVYKNRRIITNKVKYGLSVLVNEDIEYYDEPLESLGLDYGTN